MPSCWVRSSKRLKKKSSRGSIIDWHRKCIRPGALRKRSTDISPEKGSQAGVVLRSPPTDRQVSDSPTFVERPQAQPLPLPGSQFTDICNCGDSAPIEASLNKCSKSTVLLPLPKPGHVKIGKPAVDCDDYLANASNFCDGYVDTDDPLDSGPLGPVPCDYENEIISATSSPPGVKQMDQCLFANKKNSTEILSPAKIPLHNQTAIASPKQDSINSHDTRLQIRRKSGLLSAPDSSTSSPSRSPIKVFGQEPLMNSSFWLGKPYAESLLGSGQCSSPGSGHDSIAGDMSCQLIWPQSRCSPECSPLPSPRMTSPGPNSRIHSGVVTPLHPCSRESSTLMSTARPDDGKQKSHRLPLPPLKITNPSPFSPSSARTSPGTQLRSPSSPASRWKKGRLLGSGTFGQVYIGFNSETGEMCAMKEVTLFSDDAKSKESAQQLGQEIALLSRFCHPNIVRYYGSGTLDDKLYIYLEYVSGGSIHKILQEYGQLGEAAIRSYTQQILSGLAYLHTKNTLHRDIKGANILIDPSGRVKLADFGMAKHITGPSCPLSFKGSPYWMAPEVIRNSSSCNLAVDIWSLGCTVLEMATAKPPWSQYEGVAAMFKIGNSKELPEIPAHLSDEGNDFIMRCLQRNPSKRPTAAQLLEHPFVKSSASLERHVQSARSFRHSDTPLCLESPGAVIRCRIPKAAYGFSDSYTMKNVSCPVSPVRSPLSHSRSSQHMSGRLSPSPMSSPRVTSGSSTPSGHGSGTLPFHHQKQPTKYLHEGVEMIAGSQNSVFQHSNDYRDQKSNIFRGIVQAHLSPEPVSHKSDVHRNKVERPISRDQQKEQSYNPHLALADRVSQQLLRNPLRLDPVMELSSNP